MNVVLVVDVLVVVLVLLLRVLVAIRFFCP